MYIENMYFVESSVMAISLLCFIYSANNLVEKNKIILPTILAIIGITAYQGTIGFLMAFTFLITLNWNNLFIFSHLFEYVKILNVFLIDILGFIIVILLMIVHEYFHAITFSKKEDIYIWFQGFGMITHCTEIKNVKEYLYTLLLPNLLITLPLSIFVIFVKISNPLILKMIGLVSSIIILGAINDFATMVYIIRNRKQIEYLQLSGKYMYYKKK